MGAEGVEQAKEQSPDLLQKYGDHELEFMGARATLRELVAMCPVPVEERSFAANQKMMAKALVISNVALPEEYHHWLEPELQDQARTNIEAVQQEADRVEPVTVDVHNDRVKKERGADSFWGLQEETSVASAKTTALTPEQIFAQPSVSKPEILDEDWWLQRAQIEAHILAETDNADDVVEQVAERSVEDIAAEKPQSSPLGDAVTHVPQTSPELSVELETKAHNEPEPQVVDVELPEPTPEPSLELDRDIPVMHMLPIPQPVEAMVQEAKQVLGIDPAQNMELAATAPVRTEQEGVTKREDAPQKERIVPSPEQPVAIAPEAAPAVVASLPEQESTMSDQEVSLDLDAPQGDAFYVRIPEATPVEPPPEADLFDSNEVDSIELSEPIVATEQMPTFIQARLAVFKEAAEPEDVVLAETQTIKVEQSVTAFVEVLEALPEELAAEDSETVVEAELAVSVAYNELLEMIGIDDEDERQELVQAYITTIRQQVVARQEALAAAGHQSQLDQLRHFFIEGHEVISADPAATPFTQNLAHIIKKFTRLLGRLTVRSVEAQV